MASENEYIEILLYINFLPQVYHKLEIFLSVIHAWSYFCNMIVTFMLFDIFFFKYNSSYFFILNFLQFNSPYIFSFFLHFNSPYIFFFLQFNSPYIFIWIFFCNLIAPIFHLDFFFRFNSPYIFILIFFFAI